MAKGIQDLNALIASVDKLAKSEKELKTITEEVSSATEKVSKKEDDFQKNVNKVAEAQKSVKRELREVRDELAALNLAGETNTQTYAKLVLRAGELTDAMGDASQAANKAASDTANLDATLSAASVVSGSFAVATSAMTSLGLSTNDVAKAQRKLQSAIALVNGVQSIANNLNKDSALRVKLLGVANKFLTNTTRAAAGAVSGTTIALKAFKVALAGVGIGALVAVLGTVASKFFAVKDSIDTTVVSVNDMNTKVDTLATNWNNATSAYRKHIKEIEESKYTAEEQVERYSIAIESVDKKIKELEDNTTDLTNAEFAAIGPELYIKWQTELAEARLRRDEYKKELDKYTDIINRSNQKPSSKVETIEKENIEIKKQIDLIDELQRKEGKAALGAKDHPALQPFNLNADMLINMAKKNKVEFADTIESVEAELRFADSSQFEDQQEYLNFMQERTQVLAGLYQKDADNKIEADQLKRESEKRLMNQSINTIGLLSTALEQQSAQKLSQLEEGSKAYNDETKRHKKFAKTSINASTAQAIAGTWEGYSKFGTLGTVLAAAQTAALVIMGETQKANVDADTLQNSKQSAPASTGASALQMLQSSQTISSLQQQTQQQPQAVLVVTDVTAQQNYQSKVSTKSTIS